MKQQRHDETRKKFFNRPPKPKKVLNTDLFKTVDQAHVHLRMGSAGSQIAGKRTVVGQQMFNDNGQPNFRGGGKNISTGTQQLLNSGHAFGGGGKDKPY